MSNARDHHGHSHAPASFGTVFAVGIALNTLYVLGEVVFGVRANSVALLADAAHNFGDVLGLIAAWIASVLVKLPSTSRHTYGFRGSSWLAALFNAALLFVALGGIAWEAILRLANPEPVISTLIIWVAAIGIFINGGTALLFMSGQKNDINLRGAFLHMATDALAALGVVVAGILILITNRSWIDPAISLGVVALTLWSTWGLLKDSLGLAMSAVPPGVRLGEIRQYLNSLPGVTSTHDLHVWGMSTTEIALTVHLVIPYQQEANDGFLKGICDELHDRFAVEHATIQIERGDPSQPCRLAPTNGENPIPNP
jgi:cobalt-zinc-cadmium efflux system protein